MARPKANGQPPVSRSKALEDELVERIANGETLRSICREPGKPSWTMVYSWLRNDPALFARFAEARELGHDAIAEETIAMIDEPPPSTERGTDAGWVKWQSNRVEQRLKLLAKWNPRKYGDRMQVDQTVKVDPDQLENQLGSLLKKLDGTP